jgi:hypothetical protein
MAGNCFHPQMREWWKCAIVHGNAGVLETATNEFIKESLSRKLFQFQQPIQVNVKQKREMHRVSSVNSIGTHVWKVHCWIIAGA